jgi:cysteine desulfuration protein SufE
VSGDGAPVAPGLADLLAYLRQIDDRVERIELLIDIADRYRGVPEAVAKRPYPSDRLVPACESEAYFWAEDLEGPGGRFRIHFAVENPQGISARAMAVILDENLSGRPLTELAGLSGDLPLEIFGRELSLGKNMGLTGMVGMVRAAARARMRAAEPA